MSVPIWKLYPTLDALNTFNNGTLAGHLGIVFVEVGDDFLSATMPVDHRTVQPFGLLHGGASVALAETLGSVAGHHCVDVSSEYIVGLDINANHVRSAKEGVVVGTVRPVHLGRRTHVWSIEIRDAQDRLVCISRITLAVLKRS